MSTNPIIQDVSYDDITQHFEHVELSENDEHSKLQSDTEISITKYECYVCKEMKDYVVRPCNNSKCSAIICRECIKQQVGTYQDNKCGVCREPIVIVKRGEINYTKCLESYIKIFYVIFMFFGGAIITFLNALGKTINIRWINCDVSPCDDGAVGTIFFVILFLIPIWQGHLTCCKGNDVGCKCIGCSEDRCRHNKCCRYDIFCCSSLRQKLKYKSYLTILIMFFISNALIALAHVIGQPIIKSMFNKDDVYTWRTSLAGFVVYTGLLIVILIGFMIYGIYACLKNDAENRFKDMEYGVSIHNETTTLV